MKEIIVRLHTSDHDLAEKTEEMLSKAVKRAGVGQWVNTAMHSEFIFIGKDSDKLKRAINSSLKTMHISCRYSFH